MRLPVIKHIVSFIENNDEDYVVETMEILENLIDLESLKDEELDVIGVPRSANPLKACRACRARRAGRPRILGNRAARIPNRE